jgi:arylsulfatase A-like enzyme
MLRVAADIDRRTVAAGLRLLELRADLRFLAIYLGGFDNVCHAFWPYRFPDAYGDARPDARDVAEFGSVIDGYLRFLDASIARLLAAYPTPPNVIVVSDHGHEAILDHPLWRGWHGRRGMFIAHGPAFAPRSDALAVSYYDVVPTIADVMGLAVPGGMHGSSVRSARGRAP